MITPANPCAMPLQAAPKHRYTTVSADHGEPDQPLKSRATLFFNSLLEAIGEQRP